MFEILHAYNGLLSIASVKPLNEQMALLFRALLLQISLELFVRQSKVCAACQDV